MNGELATASLGGPTTTVSPSTLGYTSAAVLVLAAAAAAVLVLRSKERWKR